MCSRLLHHGIAFSCFEAADDVGGNWYHGVYENVFIISSKHATEFKACLRAACGALWCSL